jgi:hypothetical protein
VDVAWWLCVVWVGGCDRGLVVVCGVGGWLCGGGSGWVVATVLSVASGCGAEWRWLAVGW